MGAAASALLALMAPHTAAAQEVVMSTTVAPLGSGTATSRLNLDAVKPQPGGGRGLALPALSLIDDGTGLQVRSLTLQMPSVELDRLTFESAGPFAWSEPQARRSSAGARRATRS